MSTLEIHTAKSGTERTTMLATLPVRHRILSALQKMFSNLQKNAFYPTKECFLPFLCAKECTLKNTFQRMLSTLQRNAFYPSKECVLSFKRMLSILQRKAFYPSKECFLSFKCARECFLSFKRMLSILQRNAFYPSYAPKNVL